MGFRNQKEHRSDHRRHDPEKDHLVKYRSIVSSISFDTDKYELNVTTKNKWTHVGENILRLPTIKKKFSLVSKVNIGARQGGVRSLAISPKGRVVAVGLSNGEVQLRRLSTLPQNELSICLRQPNKIADMNAAVTCVRFMPNMENILISSYLSGHVDIIHTDKKCKYSLPKEPLKKSRSAQVLFTSSVVVFVQSLTLNNLNPVDFEMSDQYRIMLYGNSKCCNILVAQEFGNKLEKYGITVNAIDPVGAKTQIFNNLGYFSNYFWRVFVMLGVHLLVGLDIEEVADCYLHVLTKTGDKIPKGENYSLSRIGWKPTIMKDNQFCQAIWSKMEDLVKLMPEEKIPF